METTKLKVSDLVFLDDVPTIYKTMNIQKDYVSITMKYSKSPTLYIHKNRLTKLNNYQLEQVKLNDIQIKLINMNNISQ